MEKQQAIQKILSAIQAQGSDIMNAANGVGWMGQSSGIQQQVGEAILRWTEYDDPQPLLGAVELMQTLEILSPDEANELHTMITDVSGRIRKT